MELFGEAIIGTIGSTRSAMIKATSPKCKPQWFQRLAVIQAHLADLLAYLEKEEGFDLFIRGTRERLNYLDLSPGDSPPKDVWHELSLTAGRHARKARLRKGMFGLPSWTRSATSSNRKQDSGGND